MARTYRTLGAFLRAHHMTQQAFADEVGVTQPYIAQILKGTRQPQLHLALKIAERANIPLESLIRPDRRECEAVS